MRCATHPGVSPDFSLACRGARSGACHRMNHLHSYQLGYPKVKRKHLKRSRDHLMKRVVIQTIIAPALFVEI